MFRQFLTFLSICMAMAGIAAAQSSSTIYQQLKANGYILFSPDQMKSKLSSVGFEIRNEQQAPDGSAHALATTVGQQVFIFGFSDCAVEGCLFMRAIHPIPTAAAGLNISTAMINELNGTTPLGHYVVEQGGNVSLRYTMPAVPQCADQCIDSHLMLYLNSTKSAHQVLQEIGRQRVAKADELPEGSNFLTLAEIEQQEFSAETVNALQPVQSPFQSDRGLNGTGQLTDFTQLNGFDEWRPDFQPLLLENYDSKILNELGEGN